MVVRRKVGEPVDYQHHYSRAVKRQQEVFGQASQMYSGLLHIQKQQLKSLAEEVEYVRGHGKTDIKLLQGRALFISKAIHTIATQAKPPEVYNAICVVATDINNRVIDLRLMAYGRVNYDYHYPYTNYLGDGQTVLYPIDPDYPWYYLSYMPKIWGNLNAFFFTYSQLLRLHSQHFFPPADYRGVRTASNAYSGDMRDWFCQLTTDPDVLWEYLIHEWTKYRPYRLKPDPATRLTWRTHTPTSVKLTIDLLDVTVPTTIYHGYWYHECKVWEITIDDQGLSHLEPPQHTAILSLEDWEVLSYE